MARVNHKLVKQRLNEKRSKITDKQFFSSRMLAGHFEDLAAAQTRRYHYNRRPVFNDIGNVRRDLMDHLQILWVLLDIFPERFLIPGIRRQPESRRARIPFEAIQIVVISLD